MIVFLVGYMGCGKTTIGRRLARRLGYDFADTDDRIEKQEGADVCDIFHYAGEDIPPPKRTASAHTTPCSLLSLLNTTMP